MVQHHPATDLAAGFEIAQCCARLFGRPHLNRDRRHLAALDEGEQLAVATRLTTAQPKM
jgi:hypothetical protein